MQSSLHITDIEKINELEAVVKGLLRLLKSKDAVELKFDSGDTGE